MLLLMFYTSFIWDIHFEGNEKWTDENTASISGAGEDHTCHAKREGRLRGYRAEDSTEI